MLSSRAVFVWRLNRVGTQLMEMFRRFILVGAFVVGPFFRGSMMQIVLATLFCIIFLAVQQQVRPYRNRVDNYLALITSLLLVLLFLGCTIFKLSTLTDLQDVQQVFSREQHVDFVLPVNILIYWLYLSVLGALVFSVFLLIVQGAQSFRDKESVVRRELKKSIVANFENAERDKDAERMKMKVLLLETLNMTEQATGKLDAASHLFSRAGLHPKYWGVSRQQLEEFGDEVKQAIIRGHINGQPDPKKPYYYPSDKFNNPKIGPNMHLVNNGLIKPITLEGSMRHPAFIPGLSYTLMNNYATGGLLCNTCNHHKLGPYARR